MRILLLLALLLPIHAHAERRVVDGLPLQDPAPTGQEGLQARVFGTSNLLGEFEPCSCPSMPLGGLAQNAAVVQASRDAGVPTFWFDAGDRLFKLDMAMTGVEEAQRRLKAILLTDAGAVAGLDAAGVGRLDLGAGLGYLRLLATRARFPVLSANLLDEDGQRVFEASALITRGDRVIGVTSVLPGEVAGLGFQASDPYAAAKAEAASLRERGAELVVVLSNLGSKADKRLAKVSGADLVLSSRDRAILDEGARAGRAWLAEAGSRGRYLSDVRWYGDGKGKGPHLVVTTTAVASGGPQHPGVKDLVQRTLDRMADPLLGLPGIPMDQANDPQWKLTDSEKQ